MVRWENKPSIHTQLLRAYLALVRLSCFWKEVIVIDSSWLPICTKMNCKIIFTQYTVSQKCIIFEMVYSSKLQILILMTFGRNIQITLE